MDDYSGRIDWDDIYRSFHDPADVAERLRSRLHRVDGTLLFCGFPEAGARLARHMPVRLVDGSATVVARSRERYPALEGVDQGDVVDILRVDPAKSIAVVCRLSAFWQTPAALEALAAAVRAHPRDQVLIDFFDRDAVATGRTLEYCGADAEGRWQFGRFDPVPATTPLLHVADVKVAYRTGRTRISYDTRRAFYRSAEIGRWCERAFPRWSATVSEPLIRDDPSFCLHLVGESGAG